jgi:hypothetical protein
MTNQHSLTPPPELVQQWICRLEFLPDRQVFSEVAQWGANQELEACVKWIEDCGYHPSVPEDFRAARRPKLPTLKEQALDELGDAYDKGKIDDTTYDTIRRALEALPND